MRLRLTFLVALLALILAIPAQAQTRSVFWNQWDVTITDFDLVDNAFTVREIYEVQFNGTFRFGTAAIPMARLDAIRDVMVYQDGQSLRLNCNQQPGTFCVQRTPSDLEIVYYFNQPITNGVGNFIIEYRVEGALRVYEDGDQLWWTAVPQDKFGFAVGSSMVTVELPAEFAPRPDDPVATYGIDSQLSVDGAMIVATVADGIGANEYLEIRVQFPHSGELRQPGWQSAFDSRRAFEENWKPLVDLLFIALGFLTAIGGPIGSYVLWYTRGRDPKIGPVPKYLSEPPSDLPAAIVGALVDEKADTRDIISTLVDLAQRGYLVFEETQESGLFGLSRTSKFTFKRTDKPVDDLRHYERKMLAHIFTGLQMERTLDSLQNRFYAYLPGLKKELYEELVKEKFFDESPNKTRNRYTGIGALILVASMIAGFFGAGLAESFTETVMILPFTIGIGAVALIIAGNYMPTKTQLGAEEAAKWDAFREYIRNLERYDDAEGVADKFDKYLPYAVAFGIDREWIRRFSRIPTTPMPTWYFPTYRGGRFSGGYTAGTPLRPSSGGGSIMPDVARAGGSGGLDSMGRGLSGGLESVSSGLSQMLESASRTLTSSPSSSGGGGGWSGGGSSGGGSSGGGSRGFG